MNLFLIFQYSLVGLLVVLVTLFSSVMFCETCTEWVGQRLGLYTKNSILKFLGIGMGGVLLALQAMMSYRRAKALEDTVRNTEQGQRQERLKNAIEHLGHTLDSVRLGGAYVNCSIWRKRLKSGVRPSWTSSALISDERREKTSIGKSIS